MPGETVLHRADERKFRTRRRPVRESLFTDSLDFDRFRSANSAAWDVFCKFFLRSVRSGSAHKKIALKTRFRFQIRGAKRALLENPARIKPLFYRIICIIGIFALLYRANRMSSVAVLFFAFCAIAFRDGFGALTHNDVEESLFFSLRCSKPNVVQVDPRPH
ncbi:MAG: hypothetical protein PSV22_26045 [Pseudolabrys sp.]|nr:hypothetical protein [Pseudolabrys sp.]